MSEPELVRVRTANGYETTVSRVHAQASSDLKILDEPAVTTFGRVRPITRVGGRADKPKTTVAKKAAAKKKAAATRPAATEAVTASADDEGNTK